MSERTRASMLTRLVGLMLCAIASTPMHTAEADVLGGTSKMHVVRDANGCWFYEGDQRVMYYQRTPKSLDEQWTRANYIHPLHDLDGNVMTEDFPKDHFHQRGIYWAWHQVWVGDRRIGDSWSCQDFDWDVVRLQTLTSADDSADDSAAIRVQVLWKSPQWTNDRSESLPIVNETTTIRAHRASDDTRAIDFEIVLQALTPDVRLGGSEDEKGYGGFSARVRLPEDIEFSGLDGPIQPRLTSVAAGPWIDMVGRFGVDERVSGLAILCHPTVPGFPQPWILRPRASMQNAVYPGRHAVLVAMDEPLSLRYRLLLHRGRVDASVIEAAFQQYARTGRANPKTR